MGFSYLSFSYLLALLCANEASIGFAIPVGQMFNGPVIWRGLVYAILMVVAKCATGVWMIVLPAATKFVRNVIIKSRKLVRKIVTRRYPGGGNAGISSSNTANQQNVPQPADSSPATIKSPATRPPEMESTEIPATPTDNTLSKAATKPPSPSPQTKPTEKFPQDPQPLPPIPPQDQEPSRAHALPHKNLYPALLLGLAMTTRGEIGFLIAAIGQSTSVGGPTEVYLVVLWAILLCTLIGPIGVGVLARRLKGMASIGGPRWEILGSWG
jgi:hypothetical protein